MNNFIKHGHLRLLLVVCCLSLSGGLSGAIQQERITLDLRDVPITQFFKEIEKQTPFRFFYKNSQVENLSNITIVVQDKTLSSVLEQVFEQSNLNYEITGNQIVIFKKNQIKIKNV
jgi:type II secretory pathway component GspD/PulD (secretin)